MQLSTRSAFTALVRTARFALALLLVALGMQVAAPHAAVAGRVRAAATPDPTLMAAAQKVLASDGVAHGQFGYSVALSGDTAVIGAIAANRYKGAAYVFTRVGTTWTQQAKLTATDGAANDQFGYSVALSGDTAVIGASYANSYTGTAYVFTRIGTAWAQQAKLTAADGAANDFFGISVAASGDTAVVGAQGANSFTGAAYVFTRIGTAWAQQAKLTAADGTTWDGFGISVAASGDTAVIGARGAKSYRGAAYVFTRTGSTAWTQQAKFTVADGAAWDQFGISVALSGDTAVIGAYGAKSYRGAAYVFTRTGSTAWTQQTELTAADGAAWDRFGYSVALSGDTAVIGARDANNRGAAYVFTRTGTAWTQQAKLTAGDGAALDEFGSSVAASGDTAVIGARGANSYTGAAYFRYTPAVRYAGLDRYGTAIAISRSAFATGACSSVIIATGKNYPDALGAGGLAGAASCPILLVKDSFDATTKAEVRRLTSGRSAYTVYIVGGTGAVSKPIEDAIKAQLTGESVIRLGGLDRYATAVLVAKRARVVKGSPMGKAFVVTGANYPDVLLAAPLAYRNRWPILLTNNTALVNTNVRTCLSSIGCTSAYVIGSTTSVTDVTKTTIDAGISGTVQRAAAATNQYSQSVAVASWAKANLGSGYDGVAIATGENFPDALAAGPVQGEVGSVLLLTHSTYLDTVVRNALSVNRTAIVRVRFCGGTGAVSQAVENQIVSVVWAP